MEATLAPEAKWDPYDYGLLCNPHNAFRTIRENFPLYYNEEYDFYALSRYEDCIWGLSDRDIFRNGKGVMLEQIRSGVAMPRGLFNFEDPPVHTLHRGLLSRVFTPNRMAQLEPQIREFCTRTLDPLKNAEGFDFVRDLSSKVPMRVIGMLLGIPEEDQDEIRQRGDNRLRTEAGRQCSTMRRASAKASTIISIGASPILRTTSCPSFSMPSSRMRPGSCAVSLARSWAP